MYVFPDWLRVLIAVVACSAPRPQSGSGGGGGIESPSGTAIGGARPRADCAMVTVHHGNNRPFDNNLPKKRSCVELRLNPHTSDLKWTSFPTPPKPYHVIAPLSLRMVTWPEHLGRSEECIALAAHDMANDKLHLFFPEALLRHAVVSLPCLH